MFRKTMLAALALVTVGGAVVFADTPVMDQREKNQMRRIHKGVKKGQITKPQAAALKQDVRDVRKEKRDMIKANGGKALTKEQRMQLSREQNQNSRQIHQEKHPGAASAGQ